MDSKEYKETMKKIEEAKKMNKEAHKLSLQAEALSVIALVINFIANGGLYTLLIDALTNGVEVEFDNREIARLVKKYA